MALPVTIPNEFANATASIPLSQLDANFNTLANAVNGISDGSESLANVSVTGGNVNVSTLVVNSNNISADNSLGFRNRIINGDMRIAQRGTTANPTGTGYFTVDRFRVLSIGGLIGATAPVTSQSTTAPVGFINSFLWTNTNAVTPVTTNTAAINYFIEGTNVADLGFGTADAKTVTVSFWVRSSLTGTFGGSLQNSGSNRSYPYTYSISAADTWEYKTVTIPGDTTGTWLTDTGVGLRLNFSMGTGPDRIGTAGAWNSNNNVGATGQVQLVETAGATFYITGLQLEVGSVATPFERRPYGTELALCERYYQRIVGFNTATGTGANQSAAAVGFKTEMRSSPTPALTAPLEITRVGVADFTQSSADVAIAGSGTRVNTLAISLNFSNFTSLPTDTCLPVIVTGGILTLSAEL